MPTPICQVSPFEPCNPSSKGLEAVVLKVSRHMSGQNPADGDQWRSVSAYCYGNRVVARLRIHMRDNLRQHECTARVELRNGLAEL